MHGRKGRGLAMARTDGLRVAALFTALGLAVLSAAVTPGAFAQAIGPAPGAYAPYGAPSDAGPRGKIEPEEAARMLNARGFTNVELKRRRGPTILLEANGPRGERVQVVVDSTSGAISGMKVIGYGDRRY